jgi:predicted MPP superfamily phosphohydrolase
MIKYCVHIADIHLRTLQRHEEYKQVFTTLFSDLKNVLKDYNRDEVRIVIAGDVVHQKLTVSNELTLMIAWLFTKLEEIAPVIVIAGNHDAVLTNNDRLDSITPVVKLMDKANINYFKDSKCYLDDNIVWCVYSVFEDNKRPDIESARLEFGDDKTYIGLFHGPLIGLRTDLGFEIEHGDETNIFEGCDMVMCGDIHIMGGFNHIQKMEIFEEDLEKYLKMGWEIDN